MGKKANEDKLTGRMLLPFGVELEEELRDTARANHWSSVQDMIREAARAIVRHQNEHGVVPKDMDICQRQIYPEQKRVIGQAAERWLKSGASDPLVIRRTEGGELAIGSADYEPRSPKDPSVNEPAPTELIRRAENQLRSAGKASKGATHGSRQ